MFIMDISGIGNNINTSSGAVYDSAKSKATDNDFERKLKSAMDSKDEKQLKSVCQQFEALMLNMMYKEMKATVPKMDIIPDDYGMDTYQSMLDEQLMDNASKGSGTGLGDMLYKQLSERLKNTYKVDDGGDSQVAGKK